MTREELSNWLHNAEDSFDYSSHEPLINLSCVFENDIDEFEVVFAVPMYWLLEELNFGTLSELRYWLCNEYTSEDSKNVMDMAIPESKIAFWKIS
jgi:hypothetical protein